MGCRSTKMKPNSHGALPFHMVEQVQNDAKKRKVNPFERSSKFCLGNIPISNTDRRNRTYIKDASI